MGAFCFSPLITKMSNFIYCNNCNVVKKKCTGVLHPVSQHILKIYFIRFALVVNNKDLDLLSNIKYFLIFK